MYRCPSEPQRLHFFGALHSAILCSFDPQKRHMSPLQTVFICPIFSASPTCLQLPRVVQKPPIRTDSKCRRQPWLRGLEAYHVLPSSCPNPESVADLLSLPHHATVPLEEQSNIHLVHEGVVHVNCHCHHSILQTQPSENRMLLVLPQSLQESSVLLPFLKRHPGISHCQNPADSTQRKSAPSAVHIEFPSRKSPPKPFPSHLR